MTKRRDRGSGGVSQRKSDGMWRGQVDVGYVNGKRRRKTVYAATKRECIRKLDEAKDAIKAGDLTTSSMRVEVWLRYWLDNIAANELKPKTLEDYRSKVEQYLIPELGRHRLDRLTPIHVRELHKAMRTRDKPLSETTINHTHWVLSKALREAEGHVGLTRNVARQVPAPSVTTAEVEALTNAEVASILDAATDRSRWAFALYTGARQGECLGLRWEHVDLDAGTADLAWSLQRIPYVHGCKRDDDKPSCGKTAAGCPAKRLGTKPGLEYRQLSGNLSLVRPKTKGSIRVVDLMPGLVQALRERLAADDKPNPHGLVWHRDDGRPIDGRTDWRDWQALLDKAGVPRRPIHHARHYAATVMMNAGQPEPVIMALLGHTQVATSRRYAHLDREMTRAAAAAVAKAIEG